VQRISRQKKAKSSLLLLFQRLAWMEATGIAKVPKFR
jgi:hypothetical protein